MKIATSKTYKSIFLSLGKILGGRGNNLHEVETSDGTKFLVSMPSKFRKSVWIKRGMDGGLSTVVFSLCLKKIMMMILIAYFEQLSQTKLLRQQRGMYSHFQFRLLYYPAQFSFFIVV